MKSYSELKRTNNCGEIRLSDINKKITLKKEFSQLPEIDVLLAFENFDNDNYSDEEKIKLTRGLLRKVFSSFTSRKILSIKNKKAKE